MRIHLQDHTASVSAISSVRPALGVEFTPVEAGGTVSSLARFGKDANVINKHEHILPDLRQIASSTPEALCPNQFFKIDFTGN